MNLYLLPVNARINASAMSICDLILALYQNNTKCSNKSSFVKLSKMKFFAKVGFFYSSVFALKVFFLLFFVCLKTFIRGVSMFSFKNVSKYVVLRRKSVLFFEKYFSIKLKLGGQLT